MSPADSRLSEDTSSFFLIPALAEIKSARTDVAEGRVLRPTAARQVPAQLTSRGYRLVVTATAERSLARLPENVAAAIVEFMIARS